MTEADPHTADWIAADWGTSHLRLWAMRGAEPLARRDSDSGMAAVEPGGFADALAAALRGWPDRPVIACGMVGSRQGWVEAPYAAAPTPARPRLVQVPGRDVFVIAGVSQIDPPDVMRGEETQIAGLLAAAPEFDGVICLPGTHTKWARISAAEICHFQSFMTGEIFALLSKSSVLRHTVGDGFDADMAAFDTAVADALSRPQAAYGRLFQLRAGALVGDLDPALAAARLSGTLIGWELAAAKPYWLGQRVALVAAPKLSSLYARALAAQGADVSEADAEAATLAGLHAAWKTLKEPK